MDECSRDGYASAACQGPHRSSGTASRGARSACPRERAERRWDDIAPHHERLPSGHQHARQSSAGQTAACQNSAGHGDDTDGESASAASGPQSGASEQSSHKARTDQRTAGARRAQNTFQPQDACRERARDQTGSESPRADRPALGQNAPRGAAPHDGRTRLGTHGRGRSHSDREATSLCAAERCSRDPERGVFEPGGSLGGHGIRQRRGSPNA